MKTLYISDLDGTLLDQDACLSAYTTDTLNGLIDRGLFFSVATARTAASTLKIVKNLHFNIPIALMNGVLIYDMQKDRCIKKELLGRDETEAIIEALHKYGQSAFMYSLENDRLMTYHETLQKEHQRQFVQERIQRYRKDFVQVKDLHNKTQNDIIYFTMLDDYECLQELYLDLRQMDTIDTVLYRDTYSDHLWYLECHSKAASKRNAAKFLKAEYGFDRMVGFGDNLNDVPLFSACDECYAMQNAMPQLKEQATAVIGSNQEDGVAKQIKQLF